MRSLRDPLAWSIALCALLSLGTPLLWLTRYDLATQFEDDAFYYFQIAKNVVHGGGVSFDGLHATNGFHPLWLLLLLPVVRVCPSLDGAVRAAGLLETGLLGLAGVLAYLTQATRIPRVNAVLAGMLVFALPGTRNILRVGLESALVVALIAGIWHVHSRLRSDSARSCWLLGGLCALASLARLEAACIALVLVWLERARPRRSLPLLAPTVIAVTGYLLWNRLQFGLWLPVSGLVKQYWAREEAWHPLGLAIAPSVPLTLTAAAAVSCIGLLLHRLPAPWLAKLRPIALPLLGCAAMLGLDAVTLFHIERWYLGPAILCLAIVLSELPRERPVVSRIALACAVAAALARVPITIGSLRTTHYQAQLRGEAADGLRERLPPGTRIGAWNGGMLGYYSGQHVMILDGLANSPDFFRRALLAHDLSGYLRDERIDYLVSAGDRINPTLGLGHDYVSLGPLSEAATPGAFSLWQRRAPAH